MKTAAERKAAQRKREATMGLVYVTLKVHGNVAERIKRIAAEMTESAINQIVKKD